ncbi:DUF3793 family protein [Candidatus Clostridium stratigraminis]|uniref:DUF3793 family protein n=1 Tax=Candidatus Clostridium stratigraminis TaxID=3381661 RepID=A0ABW8T1R4_9CLOT
MTNEEARSFKNIINGYNDVDYLFSTIICSAAPTLAKEKVSSLLNFSNNNHNLQNTWKAYKGYIKDILNIDFCELKKGQENTIVLFYNKEKLETVIKDKRNSEFLTKFGYCKELSIEQCFSHLSTRFKSTFPHEIGIFLGYPVKDVAFFIEHPNKRCKMVGYWKVYDNVEEAKEIFHKYDEIRNNNIRMMLNGLKPLDIIEEL